MTPHQQRVLRLAHRRAAWKRHPRKPPHLMQSTDPVLAECLRRAEVRTSAALATTTRLIAHHDASATLRALCRICGQPAPADYPTCGTCEERRQIE